MDDARVVCRQLGFRDALAFYRGARYGQGTGLILLDDVNCSDNESSLLMCKHNGMGNHNYNHNQDASVLCEGNESKYN